MTNYAKLARAFHEAYERLAPSFGYKTREASAKPWVQVPENNRHLMIAVVQEVVGPALERAALEAQKYLLLKMQLCRKRIWIPTDVPQPEFQEIAEGAVPMWFVAKELERLHARLAELNVNKP